MLRKLSLHLVAALIALAGLSAQAQGEGTPGGGPSLDVSGPGTAGIIEAHFRNMPERYLTFLCFSPNPGQTQYGPFPLSIGSPTVLCTVGAADETGRLDAAIVVPLPIPEVLRGRTFHFQGASIHWLTRPNLIALTNTDQIVFGL